MHHLHLFVMKNDRPTLRGLPILTTEIRHHGFLWLWWPNARAAPRSMSGDLVDMTQEQLCALRAETGSTCQRCMKLEADLDQVISTVVE